MEYTYQSFCEHILNGDLFLIERISLKSNEKYTVNE